MAPYPVAVYLAGGSGLAMAFLLWSARSGRIARDDLGLGPSGWTPFRRLGGLTAILLVAGAGVATSKGSARTRGRGPPGANSASGISCCCPPAWRNCSSFVGMGFCLMERGLRAAGLRPIPATLIAAAICSVTFGLYHYTHEPRWWDFVYALMIVMAVVVLFFAATRNFYLTLAFHNAMAALGFFTAHYAKNPLDPTEQPLDPTYFSEPRALTANLVSFAIPFVLLHLLEWKGWPQASGGRQPPDAAGSRSPDAASGG